MIKPIPLRAPVPGGFTSDDFTIDFDARTVTCPAGHTVAYRTQGRGEIREVLPYMSFDNSVHDRQGWTSSHHW